MRIADYEGSGNLLIIDGHSISYRAYYGMPALSAPNGVRTGAVNGFLSMLLRIIKETEPEYIAAAFDRERPDNRIGIYQGYKSNRDKMPEDLISQMELIYELMDILKIPVISFKGWEADDAIGSLAKSAEKHNINCVIASSDMDLLQLVSPTIKVMKLKKGTSDFDYYGENEVEYEYGFPPKGIIEYKALAGDSSDNIPGGKGIGDKTAKQIIADFGSAENAINSIHMIKGRTAKLIEASKESILMSRKLAEIKTDLPAEITEDMKSGEIDSDKLAEFLKRLGMDKMLGKLFPDIKISSPKLSPGFTENSGISSGNDIFVIFDGEYAIMENGDRIKPENLGSYACGKRVCSFDIKPLLKKCGNKNGFQFLDIALLCWLANPEYDSHDMKKACRSILMEEMPETPSEKELFCLLRRMKRTAEINIDAKGMKQLAEGAELPLIRILADMETAGMLCDTEILMQADIKAREKTAALEEKIFAAACEKFNINSPKQLACILYDKLQLPCPKKRSTDADALEELKHMSPIIPMIQEYREAKKIQTTYTSKLPSMIEADGRIRTNLDSMKTATGRLSSSDPNLQNIPVRTEQGREIRKAFIPAPGCILMSADYSQIELRVMAHFSEDEKMSEAFSENLDIHSITAGEIFGVNTADVTPEMRSKAKQVNFGIIYGISAHGLAKSAGCSRKEAAEYIARYFKKFPGIERFISRTIKDAAEKGFVETLCGRRRYIENISSRNAALRSAAERIAVNTVIQGTAADIIKAAMIKSAECLKERKLKSKMLLQIHDELLFEVRENEISDMRDMLKESMEKNIPLKIPMSIKIKEGQNWGEME